MSIQLLFSNGDVMIHILSFLCPDFINIRFNDDYDVILTIKTQTEEHKIPDIYRNIGVKYFSRLLKVLHVFKLIKIENSNTHYYSFLKSMSKINLDKTSIQIVNKSCEIFENNKNLIKLELNIDTDNDSYNGFYNTVDYCRAMIILNYLYCDPNKHSKNNVTECLYTLKHENETVSNISIANLQFCSNFYCLTSIIYIRMLFNNTNSKKKPYIGLNNLRFTSLDKPTFSITKNKTYNKNNTDECVSSVKYIDSHDKKIKTLGKKNRPTKEFFTDFY